jgi:hypothetical protein
MESGPYDLQGRDTRPSAAFRSLPTGNSPQKVVPGLSIGDSQGQAHIFVRGIGPGQVFTGADPSVAVHLDGAVIAQRQAQLSAFFDLERVDVLQTLLALLGGDDNFLAPLRVTGT